MKKQYIINTDENKDFCMKEALGLLEFGEKFPSPGGGSYYLGKDGMPLLDRPRETWITSRMVHVYSIGKMLGYKNADELAKAGLKGLLGELKDDANGGWYAGRTAEGGILPSKQCYAHAFVILAATSALIAKVDGAKELLDEALLTYDKYFWNEAEGLSCDTWNTEFTVLDDYRGLNANMHTVEAFLAVADAIGDEKYRIRAGRIIDHVIGWAKNNNWRIPEHFNSDWSIDLECNAEKPDDQFKPYGATCGHGIEWARLISQWAVSTYGEKSDDSKSYIDAASNLFNRAIEDGWNSDGQPGIVYTTDWEGKPVVRDRMHWTLCEAINSAAVLYKITGDEKYSGFYEEFSEYMDEKVLDHEYGSWFHQLDENNNPKETVWPGKPDLYHAFQAMLIPYNRVDLSIAKAVAESKMF